MSSDFLSKPCDVDRFSLIYAHAQKNIGPAGVTVVVVRKDLIENAATGLPGFLDYRVQAQAHSNYNTPPVFAIYAVLLITRWLLNDIGGLTRMDAINQQKADLIYSLIDQSDGFFRGRATIADRSRMNVVFNLPTPELEKHFLTQSLAAGFSGLAGHRAIGGIRASIYNAVTPKAVEELADFMHDFWRNALQK
jgi:phosphoserine aminotransferase